MFQIPTEVKAPTGESLVYCPRRVCVSKEFTFDAAHHLFDYEGKCKALHGHTYHLQIAVSGFLDHRGIFLNRIQYCGFWGFESHLQNALGTLSRPPLPQRKFALHEHNSRKHGVLDFQTSSDPFADRTRYKTRICASV